MYSFHGLVRCWWGLAAYGMNMTPKVVHLNMTLTSRTHAKLKLKIETEHTEN